MLGKTEMTSVSLDLMDRIRQAAASFGSGGRAVADLVVSRPEEVALLPAAKVGPEQEECEIVR
jgi:hypothetical protein